ncbi:MAG: phosphoribosylanthranilate isomerase [Endomicrobia bacterium]|nr:phosphoribosylanthranilate isomerase [Endomicrobiia bacterium]
MAKVKICGLASYGDALDATNLGADFLGFHFIKESPKKVSEKLVCDIMSKLPPFVTPVGVFANEEQKAIAKTVKKCNLKNVQFNADESPEFCKAAQEVLGVKVFKFFKLENESDILKLQHYIGNVDYFMLDVGYIGGETANGSETADGSETANGSETVKYNYEFASKAGGYKVPFFISGSITPEDIEAATEAAAPFGFDGDAGIERLPKRKDYDKMNAFIRYSHGLK